MENKQIIFLSNLIKKHLKIIWKLVKFLNKWKIKLDVTVKNFPLKNQLLN